MRLLRLLRIIGTALMAIRRNPMRASLTMLGIIIGVASVIAMMEIGQGSSAAIQTTIASMGANTLMVLPGTAASGGITFGAGSNLTLSPDDSVAIARQCDAVSNVAMLVRVRGQVVAGNRNWVPMSIYGTTPEYLDVRDWNNLSEGDMFTETDILNANKVCVIGQTIVRSLFDGENPVGKELRIRNVAFRVIGVLSSKGANMMGMDQDDIVLAPWTTIKYRVSGVSSATSSAGSSETSSTVNSLNNLYPSSKLNLYPTQSATQAADTPQLVRFTNIDQIIVATDSAEKIQPAIEQITETLRRRHRLLPEEPSDFDIRNMAEITKTLSATTFLMTNLLLCVALISLVVGGVGIMNIMLVSVTERTREIGLRMSVGARSRDILRQFLVEAMVLTLAGGIIGILLGCGGSYLVTLLLRWPTQASVPAILASVIVSASVGIVFGFYPAWKASRLDPIEALRYE